MQSYFRHVKPTLKLSQKYQQIKKTFKNLRKNRIKTREILNLVLNLIFLRPQITDGATLTSNKSCGTFAACWY
jgi:hypothetical protein